MTRHTVTLTLRPPTWLDRIWYRRIKTQPPLAISERGLVVKLARLVPYGMRGFHRVFAASTGYFWLRCPLCDSPFGGHESGVDVPDPTRAPDGYVMVCSRCSRMRDNYRDEG